MDVSSHTVSLPAGAGAPEWVHLLPAGTFSGADGKQFKLTDPARVIAASMTNGKLPLDENHSTQRAPAMGAPSPARAWIVELQSREDGIWGRPEWNESGTALMTDKSYKGLSPVFTHTKDGTVIAILSAALTNNPNLTQLTALHTNGNDMDKIAICTALGLAATVDDAAVLTALQTLAQSGTALQTAQADVTRLSTEREQLKRTHVPADQVVALQTRLETLEVERKRAAAIAFVDGAIAAGKAITPVRDLYIAQHVADPATTEKLINAMVSINARGAGGKVPAMNDAGEDALSDAETTMCTKMNIDPKAFLATKKKMAPTTEGSAA